MGATDLNGGVNRLNALFNAEPPEPTTDVEQQPQETANAVETEIQAEEPQVEATPEQDEPKYTVKINGEEQEVTLDELQKGYMMQSDYSRKTAEVSEKRKAIEAKELEITNKLNEAEQLLQFELDDLQSPEMLELKDYDPDSYWKKVDAVKGKAERFNAKKQKQQEQLLAKKQKLLADEQEKLLQAIPDWAIDAEKMQTESQEAFKALGKLGFSNDELSGLSDHRMLVIGKKLALLEQIQAQKPEEKLVNKPPKSVKPNTKPTNESLEDTQTKEMKAKLSKSGKQQDAANLIKRMLGG
jgi:hypothetical protein